ncbi:Glycoside hydrolase [Mycena venus]|uniref:Glycoside hydrolase n=1 Tax=Mycena venus TaxID=2733690 RepID=A0A8H7CQS2_9AGAR|nr:Glycoside hydrolase [Mycena venus]
MPPSTGFDVAPTIGALEIGVLFAVCLFGALTVQASFILDLKGNYLNGKFKTGGSLLHSFSVRFVLPQSLGVALVWCLDLSHTIAICNAIYIVTVVQYGHPELLEFVPDSLNLTIIISGFIGPLEQGWFAYRLYKFSHSLYLPLFCAFLSASRACGSVVVGAIACARPIPVIVFIDEYGWIVEVLLVIGAVTDIILVLGLCYYLSAWRGDGFERMNQLVNRLMQWSIETGLITSVGAIALLICFVTMKDNFNWIAISAVLPKLFSNSLLFSLNARKPLLHLAPDLRRRDSFPSLNSSDPLTSEFKIDDVRFKMGDISCPKAATWRSDRYSFSAVSLHNSYIFPPGEGMPTLAP